MLNLAELQLQQLDLNGVRTLTGWAQAEGWNPGLHDAEIFYNTDPHGFYGYFLDGQLIAAGSIVAYGHQYGFMGFFIVQPQHRAAGIGRRLWYQRCDKLRSRLNPGASIGMDGVVAMQPFYHKCGFEIAHRDERHERKGAAFEVDSRVTMIEAQDLDAIIDYDRLCFGFDRIAFLLPWLSQPGAYTFKFTDKGTLQGFAVLRKCDIGYKVGPLFAGNATAAEELYKACLNAVPGEPVFIDIPVSNTAAVALTRKYETTFIFECARMYLNGPATADMNKVFGITSFELG